MKYTIEAIEKREARNVLGRNRMPVDTGTGLPLQ